MSNTPPKLDVPQCVKVLSCDVIFKAFEIEKVVVTLNYGIPVFNKVATSF